MATHTPWGYAGVVDRYVDAGNFYLFLVDGEGRFRPCRCKKTANWRRFSPGQGRTFLIWRESTNTLTVDDDGRTLRFYGNGMLLFEGLAGIDAGGVGLVGGAQDAGAAEIRFDWLQLYDLALDARN